MTKSEKNLHQTGGWRTWLKALPVLFTVLILIYYCVHPDLYSKERDTSLFLSPRTYEISLLCVLLIMFWLLPIHISDHVNRILSWVWFAVAPFAVYFSLYYLNATRFKIHFFELNRIALLLTFVFLYLVQGILFGLTGSIRFSVIIYAVFIAALGIVNQFVVSFRGMALSASDLFSIGTAMTVAGDYDYELTWYMLIEILLTFAICSVSLRLRGGRMLPPGIRALVLALVAVLSGGYYYLCGETSFLEDHDIRSKGYTHQLRYRQYDMIFTTLTTCFYLVVDKPAGYSVDAVEAIAEPYVEEEDEEKPETPNIIVIMNESLADYDNIGCGLRLTEDCMPFIHSLYGSENTITGTVYSSVFGSNTPNSEYEFLTGNTMAFLPTSSVAFHLFVRGDLPSLASELDDYGYWTLAMHPYRGTNYKRNIVYPQIGFQNYYTRDNFHYANKIRNYITDEELFNRIIKEFDEHLYTGKPFFSWNVSIQNHGGYYSSNTKNMDLSISVLNPGINLTRSKMYVNLVRETDRAFEEFIDYFRTVEKPVVIIMYGDHQPDLGEETYEYLLGATDDELTSEELMEKYKVPFIVWANYDIGEETIDATSLTYLYSQIADRLDLPMTGYQKYLLDLSEEVPVINPLGYWGADGNFYELDDKDSPYYDLVNDYNILEYNDIFGGDNRYREFFAE